MSKNVISYGLTGGIGSGKSTALKIFRELGAVTLDADEFCHELVLKDKKAYSRIVDCFGASILNCNGKIDRKRLGSIAFSDPEKLQMLNNILHPLLLKKRKRIVSGLARLKKASIFITEAALIFEAGAGRDFDGMILTVSEEKIRIERLLKRGFSLPDIEKRISAQWNDEKKIPLSDFIIYNNGSLQELRDNVHGVYKDIWRRF